MDSLSPAQEDHLRNIKADFDAAVDRKYRAGAAEHGGNLWDKSPLQLCEEAIAEAIDQVTFLLTLRNQLITLSQRESVRAAEEEG
jgi:hypothetical protein